MSESHEHSSQHESSEKQTEQEKVKPSTTENKKVETEKKTPEGASSKFEKVKEEVIEGKGKISPFLSKKGSDEETDAERDAYHKKQQASLDAKIRDNAVFSRHCKLYFYLPSTGRLETRGSGTIMILKTKSKLQKILMIRDSLMLKGCDHYVAPSANLVKAVNVENAFVWVALDDQSDAEDNMKKTTYFASFDNSDEALEFKKFYATAQANNKIIFEELKNKMAAA